jgi:hypothetical protein
MKHNMKTMIVVILGLFGIAACGGGGGGGDGGGGGSTSSPPPDTGPSVASLQGTWFGAYQITSSAYTLGVDVNNSSGGISAVRRNGISQGLTGSLSKDHGNIFDFTLSDGTTGGFFADNNAMHVAFLNRGGDFGVLQKGASALPTYGPSDIRGSWSGYTVALDSNMNITNEGVSSAAVVYILAIPPNPEMTLISGNDIFGSFSGSITPSPVLGAYYGNWRNATGSGTLRAWLSVDKTFAAVWACRGSTSYVVSIPNCTFSAWRKQ